MSVYVTLYCQIIHFKESVFYCWRIVEKIYFPVEYSCIWPCFNKQNGLTVF